MSETEKTTEENKEDPEIFTRGSWRREHRRAHGGGEPWIVGIILILVGGIFLLQNLGGFYFENWWALFILIPAVGSFSRAWRSMRDSGGKLTTSARGAFIGGLVFTAIAGILFFNLDWVIFGPILLIAAGVAMLLNAVMPK